MATKRVISREFLATLEDDSPYITILGRGRPPVFALHSDQRFSFTLQLPKSFNFKSEKKLPVLVLIHGTGRETDESLKILTSFADETNTAILAPLFPCGIIDPQDINNYKCILYKGMRFDQIVFDMLEQAAPIWGLETSKFFLHGYSGGGQFTNRFFYLHPERLLAVGIGAPGSTTPPDSTKAWPHGISNLSTIFSLDRSEPDWEAMRKVPILLIVGSEDTDTKVIGAANDAFGKQPGATRVERIELLRDALEAKGIATELQIVPGVAHNGRMVLPQAAEWFTKIARNLQ